MKVAVDGHRPRRCRVQRLGVPRLVGGREVPDPLVVLLVGREPGLRFNSVINDLLFDFETCPNY